MADPIMIPWLLEIGIISWRSFTGNGASVTKSTGANAGPFSYGISARSTPVARPPLPSEILSTFVVFGAYSIVANGQGARRTIGSMLAWGTVIATGLAFASNPPTKATGTISTVSRSQKVAVA